MGNAVVLKRRGSTATTGNTKSSCLKADKDINRKPAAMSQCQMSSFNAGGTVTLHCGDVTDDVKHCVIVDNNVGDGRSIAAAAAEPGVHDESPATIVIAGSAAGASCSGNPLPEIRIAPAADPSEGPSGSATSSASTPASTQMVTISSSVRSSGRPSGSACGTSKVSVSSLFPHHPVAPPPQQQRQSARWRSERRLSVPIGKPLCPRCVDEPYIFSLAQAVDALKSSGGTAVSAGRRLSDPGRGVGNEGSRSAVKVSSDEDIAVTAAAAADVAGLAGRRLVFVGKQSAPSSSTSAARIAKTKDATSTVDPDATAAASSKSLPLPSVDELSRLMQFDVVAPSSDAIDVGTASVGTIKQGNETTSSTSTATGSAPTSTSSVRSSRFLSLPTSVTAAAVLGGGSGRVVQQRGGSQPRRHSVALMTGSTSRQLEAIAEESAGSRIGAAAAAAVACGGLTTDHGQSLRRYSLTVPGVTSSDDDMKTLSDEE